METLQIIKLPVARAVVFTSMQKTQMQSYAVTYIDADGNKKMTDLADSKVPNKFDIRRFQFNTYWEISVYYEETDNYHRSEALW